MSASIKVRCKGEIFVSDGGMQMTRNDTVLIVIMGGFTAKFKDPGSEVLKSSGLSNVLDT